VRQDRGPGEATRKSSSKVSLRAQLHAGQVLRTAPAKSKPSCHSCDGLTHYLGLSDLCVNDLAGACCWDVEPHKSRPSKVTATALNVGFDGSQHSTITRSVEWDGRQFARSWGFSSHSRIPGRLNGSFHAMISPGHYKNGG
jgi:hypothetical protein